MIIAEIVCERTNDIHTCALEKQRKAGKIKPKVLANACLGCISSRVKFTSAGVTRSKAGISHLYAGATTLGEFTDD